MLARVTIELEDGTTYVVYHRRSIVKVICFALEQRYGDTLRARMWYGQFRDLVLKAAVKNIKLES